MFSAAERGRRVQSSCPRGWAEIVIRHQKQLGRTWMLAEHGRHRGPGLVPALLGVAADNDAYVQMVTVGRSGLYGSCACPVPRCRPVPSWTGRCVAAHFGGVPHLYVVVVSPECFVVHGLTRGLEHGRKHLADVLDVHNVYPHLQDLPPSGRDTLQRAPIRYRPRSPRAPRCHATQTLAHHGPGALLRRRPFRRPRGRNGWRHVGGACVSPTAPQVTMSLPR